MKVGDKVRTTFDGKEGISMGPVFSHFVWCLLIMFGGFWLSGLVVKGLLYKNNHWR